MADEVRKPAKHVCLTNRNPLMISSDPEADIIAALADADAMTMVRGLAKQTFDSPFTNGVFGMDEARVNAAVRKLKNAGLICSRRIEDHHQYYLNVSRLRFLADSLNDIAKSAESLPSE